MATNHGVRDRSTLARSLSSQRCCREPDLLAAYEQREITCIGPMSRDHQRFDGDPEAAWGMG